MNFQRLSAKHILIIVLLVVHLAPIWICKYFPTQDGSSHIYNAYVLKNYHKQENYKIREVYKLNLTLFPNWTSHAFLALLMYVFPPLVCEKILLSLCIALTPLALFYFLNAVDRGKMLFGLLGFIYAFNYLLHMGFYSFALSVPMFFFALGYWWKYRWEMKPVRLGVFYILLFITYFCHFQSYFQVVLCISFFALFSVLYLAFVETFGYRKTVQGNRLRVFIKHLKPFLLFIGYMLPAYFIALSYYLSKTQGYERSYWDLKQLTEYFFNMKSIVCYKDNRILIGHIILGLLAVTFLITFCYRIREVYRSRKSAMSGDSELTAPAKRLWTKIIDGKEQFLLMAGILTVIFFRSPWGVDSGGGWINDRVHIYIFLVLLPFFSVSFHRYIRYAIAGIIIVLSLWHLAYDARTYYYMSKETAEMNSGIGILEEHSTLKMMVTVWDGSAQRTSDHLGPFKYVSPFLFVPCYYALENDIAFVTNYEAEHDYFPVNYTSKYAPPAEDAEETGDDDEDAAAEEEDKEPADYIYLSRFGDYDELDDERRKEVDEGLEKVERDYTLIQSGKHYKIYRLKKSEADKAPSTHEQGD